MIYLFYKMTFKQLEFKGGNKSRHLLAIRKNAVLSNFCIGFTFQTPSFTYSIKKTIKNPTSANICYHRKHFFFLINRLESLLSDTAIIMLPFTTLPLPVITLSPGWPSFEFLPGCPPSGGNVVLCSRP